VARAADIAQGEDDAALVADALRLDRIVLTCDKGFGDLIH